MKKISKAIFIVIFVFIVIIPLQNFGSVFYYILNGKENQITRDKGTGPFKDVKLGVVDKVKANKGMAIFMQKCFLCHDLDNKKLGPPLRNVTKEDTPEFILNMIVNPMEMQKTNPKIKEQIKKYNNLPMIDQQISKPDALIILEYLRSVAK